LDNLDWVCLINSINILSIVTCICR
jgi:hypothetical protein